MPKQSEMFSLDKIKHKDIGEVKTCKRCYHTNNIVYSGEMAMDVLVSNPYIMVGCCSKCGCKVFIEGFK